MSHIYVREKFYRATKTSEETIQEWMKRLETLAESCGFSEEKDEILRDVFIIGLGRCPVQDNLVQEIDKNHNLSFTVLKMKALVYEKMLSVNSKTYFTGNSTEEINNDLLKSKITTKEKGQSVDNSYGNVNTQTNINANQVIQNFSKPRDPILPFNLRATLSNFEGRQLEMKLIYDYFEQDYNKIVVIYGLFGTGKTALANKYAWENIKYYNNNIIWIQYETEKQFKNMFVTIRKELDPKSDNLQKPIRQLVNDIYSYFEKKHKCLFIFDDVLSRSYINDILPNDSYKNIRVLITSPYAKWGNIKTLNLSFLSEGETMSLFKSITKNLSCAEIQEDYLKNCLYGLPLEIQLFASHIANITDETDKIIHPLKYSQNILYDKPFPKWTEHNIEKTIYTSFTTAVHRISCLVDQEETTMALKILNYFPYYEDIPYSLLKELFNKNLLIDAIGVLVDCCLIYRKDKNIYMHKFLQSLVLMDQQKSGKETVWYKETLDCILDTKNTYEIQERRLLNFAAERKEAVLKVYKNNTNQGKLIQLLNKYECQFALDYIFSPSQSKKIQIKPEIKYKHVKKQIVKVNEDNQILECLTDVEIDHPITDATRNGHLDVIKLLIEADENLVYKLCGNGWIPFHTAAAGGYIHILTYFLQIHKVPINIQNKMSSTALHLAALNGKTDAVSFLLEQGASVDVLDEKGNTALHYACQTLHVETVKVLLASGIPIDKKNEKGDTPFHFAALEGRTEVVGFLYTEGSDIDARDDFNNNALHFSAQRGHVETTKKLIELGCSLHVENHFGNTPLNLAVLKRQLMLVKILCENGCRPDEATEHDGSTPLSIASKNGYTEILSYFLTQFPDLFKPQNT